MDAFPTPPENQLSWRYFRASGPGGQHRNKVATGVHLTHLPTGVSVTATERRSRAQNKSVALKRLVRRLADASRPVKPRRPTRPSRAARRRRLENKRRRSALKHTRRRPAREDW